MQGNRSDTDTDFVKYVNFIQESNYYDLEVKTIFVVRRDVMMVDGKEQESTYAIRVHRPV
ncbi:hypothetical protein TcasGA2_TC008144 [Tribolium castaneum]|uniref:Uncharacterized protein n=1 Tax=Tribolium castaneum TaxID=7070 RepID=D2A018_TRICA|nr:hypothetical protein TcasGA2_TC008144 [Tribolium castaneum]